MFNRNFWIIFSFLVLGGCRIVQLPGAGGAIVTPDNLYSCLERTCEVDIESAAQLVFLAEPDPGFEFVAWKELCWQNDTPRCELSVNEKLAAEDIEVEQVALFAPIPQDDLATERIVIDTNYGYIVMELFGVASPATVQNFLTYLEDGFYDATVFHRAQRNFVIQGGGYSYTKADGFQEKVTRDPIVNEATNGISNLRGTVAMARLAGANTARAQFYVNLADNLHLDYVSSSEPGYAVFGRVVAGMDVVDEIGNTRYVSNRNDRDPVVVIEIRSITRHGPPTRG